MMVLPPNPASVQPLAQQLNAAFGWWQLAGVDADFANAPHDWLAREAETSPATPHSAPAPTARAEPRPAERAPAPAAATQSLPEAAALPPDLPGFIAWWMTEPLLDGGRTTGRVPPRGQPGAALMILVHHPEAEDTDRLLSGPQGAALERMLRAMAIDPATVYLASALPRHTPHADWDAIHARGLAQILAHHVALVAPERLLVLGGNILPLAGHDLPKSPASLQRFNHGKGTVPLLVERGLDVLPHRPRAKAAFWQHWLEWTAPAEPEGHETP